MYNVRLIVPALGRNPDFNRRLPVGPDNPVDVLRPVGFAMSGPDCWLHCMPDPASGIVRAEPADEATKIKVDGAMKAREQSLAERANRKEKQLAELSKQRSGRRRQGGNQPPAK